MVGRCPGRRASCGFGSARAARFLVERGAPIDLAGDDHDGTPLVWVAHGSRFSGDAERRVASYVEITELLCEAGASFVNPADPAGDPCGTRLLDDAVPAVAQVLERHGATRQPPR
jgi:hypothetical protein